MNQVNKVAQYEENNLNSSDYNRFSACEDIVDALVEQGLSKNFNPDTYMDKISKAYGINIQEARTCLKLAIRQLESEKTNQKDSTEKLNAQSEYFYPSYTKNKTNSKHDGMDSLTSLANYNRLMFQIR